MKGIPMKKRSLIALAALISACASKPPMGTPEYDAYAAEKAKEERISNIDQTIDNAPSWYKETVSVPGYFVATGTDVSSDMQFAMDKALMGAKIAIASQISSHITSSLKLYISETGAASDVAANTEVERVAKEMVAEVKIHGFEIDKHQIMRDGTHYRAYVLVKMPRNYVAQKLVNNVRNNATLAPKVERSAAFKQLEQDIQKFRNQKN